MNKMSLNPAHGLNGGFLTFVSVCLSVCKMSKNLLNRSTSFFGGGLRSDAGMEPFDFEKKSPRGKGGCVSGEGANFALI